MKSLKTLRMLGVTLLLTSLLCVSGCGVSGGVSLWPLIKISPATQFTPEEKAALAQFAADHPDIAQKIVGRNNELAKAVESYNRHAIEHNRDILKIMGASDEDIERLYPKEK